VAPYSESELTDAFQAAADRVAASRPGVDLDIARELMGDAAQMLHNSLAIEFIDERDARAVIEALADDLVAEDPGAAVRARAAAVAQDPGALHDPEAAAAAYLTAAQVLRL
jgi:hydrogenase maturation factor